MEAINLDSKTISHGTRFNYQDHLSKKKFDKYENLLGRKSQKNDIINNNQS